MSSKEQPLKKMFARLPERYDFVNRVVTLGLDVSWRKKAVEACLEKRPRRILDLCAGTGDLTIMLAERADFETGITAADFSAPMLREAKRKALKAGVAARIEFELIDAADMPFCDGAFDTAAVSFGFRNLTFQNPNREKHLREIYRIVAPGGRLVIVESSQPESLPVRAGFRLYLKSYVTVVGRLMSGGDDAYRYLAHSVERFYRSEEIERMLIHAGFSSVRTTPLLMGAAALHVASK